MSELRLLHFHVGSQVSDIATIKEAMRESSQMYAELVRLGAPMGLIDVGGGLGVDYDGSRGWGGRASRNYDEANYANDVVAALADACARAGIEPPTIVSESGRAIVSASAALVFQIVSTDPRGARGTREANEVAFFRARETEDDKIETPTLEALRSMPPSRFLLHNFREVARNLRTAETANVQEAINDATQFRQEADRLFKLGIMGLEERAEAEELFCATRARVFHVARERRVSQYVLPVDVQTEARRPAVWYHANMSVFRSLPDIWAIQQLFPVAPLHRLRERPNAAGSLADLTCDSDGRVDAFVGAAAARENVFSDAERGAPSPFLKLHAPREGEPYLMAAFLVGAYQESMGARGATCSGRRRRRASSWRRTEEKNDAGIGARFVFVFVSHRLGPRRRRRRRFAARGDTNADALRGAGVDRKHRGVGAERRRRRRRSAPRRRRRRLAREHVFGIVRERR